MIDVKLHHNSKRLSSNTRVFPMHVQNIVMPLHVTGNILISRRIANKTGMATFLPPVNHTVYCMRNLQTRADARGPDREHAFKKKNKKKVGGGGETRKCANAVEGDAHPVLVQQL